MELFSIVRTVRTCLTDDLRKKKYRGSPNPVAGHCYVASEALFWILKKHGIEGWHPMFIRHEGEPHWFLRHDSGMILDATSDQFKKPVPYSKAKGKGFLTKHPSARAVQVICRWHGYTKNPKKPTLRQLADSCVKAVDPSYSIKWKKVDGPMDTHTWDGSGLLRMSEADPLKAIHDVAHIMLAPPSRRKLPEFGLGEDPSNGKYARCVVSFEAAQREEYKACDLHWALAAYLEGTKGASFVESYLNMNHSPSEKTIVDMAKYGGLPWDFVPTVLAVPRAL